MKYLLVIVVVGVLLWLMFGSGRRARVQQQAQRPPAPPGPQAMLACAHCGVHLPAAEAQLDAQRRPYCSEAHRLAGPRRPG